MNAREIQTLFQFNFWANDRVIQAAQKVSQEQFTAAYGSGGASLRGRLVHAFGAEWLWRMRTQKGLSPSSMPSVESVPSAESLAKQWNQEEKEMQAYVASLKDADLDRVVKYKNTAGQPLEFTLGQLLTQVIGHGIQTRSEAAFLLTEYGSSPGDLDYIAYLGLIKQQARG